MKTLYLMALVIFTSNVFAKSLYIPGELELVKEIEVPIGFQLQVPECKIWTLLDSRQYDKNNKVKIDGDIEIRSEPRRTSKAVSYMSGSFFFETKNGQPDQGIRIMPKSDVFFFSKTGVKTTIIKEWTVLPDFDGNCVESSHNKRL